MEKHPSNGSARLRSASFHTALLSSLSLQGPLRPGGAPREVVRQSNWQVRKSQPEDTSLFPTLARAPLAENIDRALAGSGLSGSSPFSCSARS